MSTKPVYAKAVVRNDKRSTRLCLPIDVKATLGARNGDNIIFTQGSFSAAEQAALKGAYFIITCEPASPEEQQAPSSEEPKPEPFTASVQRKTEERGGK